MANQRAAPLSSSTSLHSRLDPALNYMSHIPLRKSQTQTPRVCAKRCKSVLWPKAQRRYSNIMAYKCHMVFFWGKCQSDYIFLFFNVTTSPAVLNMLGHLYRTWIREKFVVNCLRSRGTLFSIDTQDVLLAAFYQKNPSKAFWLLLSFDPYYLALQPLYPKEQDKILLR